MNEAIIKELNDMINFLNNRCVNHRVTIESLIAENAKLRGEIEAAKSKVNGEMIDVPVAKV